MSMEYGLYVPKVGIVHRLDPRAKIMWFILVLSASILLQYDGFMALLVFMSILIMMRLSGLHPFLALLLIAYGIVFFLMVFFTWAFMYSGVGTVLVEISPLKLRLTTVGISVALGKFFLIVNPVFTAMVILASTRPYEFVQGLVRLGIPYKVCYIALIALNMFSVIVREIRTIIDVQKTRGLSLDTGPILVRLRNYAAILIPLVIKMIADTWQLGLVLAIRGFGYGGKRTYIHEIKWSSRDTVFITVCTLIYTGLIMLNKVIGFSLSEVVWEVLLLE